MPGAVADTHAVVWYLLDSPQLSAPASAQFEKCRLAGATMYSSTRIARSRYCRNSIVFGGASHQPRLEYSSIQCRDYLVKINPTLNPP
jgi:hypothetical protein